MPTHPPAPLRTTSGEAWAGQARMPPVGDPPLFPTPPNALRNPSAGARLGLLVLASGLLLPFTGCAAHRYEQNRIGAVQRGVASWYGGDFHGRRTASGKIYDMHDMTAAHRELPLGTLVEVRNLENGRSIRVEVTDRGPFSKGRILDVSYAAAKELGMIQKGTARVEVQILDLGAGPSGPRTATRFAVQVGAFKNLDNAKNLHRQLRELRPDVELVEDGRWHKVRIGLFSSLGSAEAARDELARLGYSAAVVFLN